MGWNHQLEMIPLCFQQNFASDGWGFDTVNGFCGDGKRGPQKHQLIRGYFCPRSLGFDRLKMGICTSAWLLTCFCWPFVRFVLQVWSLSINRKCQTHREVVFSTSGWIYYKFLKIKWASWGKKLKAWSSSSMRMRFSSQWGNRNIIQFEILVSVEFVNN